MFFFEMTELSPLLGKAFPHNRLEAKELAFLADFQPIVDTEIAPLAAEHDAAGRYPTRAISALKRSGVLQTSIPKNLGAAGSRTDSPSRRNSGSVSQIRPWHRSLRFTTNSYAKFWCTVQMQFGRTSFVGCSRMTLS